MPLLSSFVITGSISISVRHEIAHDHGTAGRRLEAEPAAECQCGLDGHAVDSHLKVAARKAVAVDIGLY